MVEGRVDRYKYNHYLYNDYIYNDDFYNDYKNLHYIHTYQLCLQLHLFVRYFALFLLYVNRCPLFNSLCFHLDAVAF